MNVWLITTGEPLTPFEPSARAWRSHLLAQELARRGHTLCWWTSSFDHIKKRQYVSEDVDVDCGGVRYCVLHAPGYRRNISMGRLLNHAWIARRFMRRARESARPDVIFCSYPTIELSAAAVAFGRRLGIPVLLDIRDLWPDVFLSAVPKWVAPAARLALFPYYWSGRYAIRHAAGLVAVSEGYLHWGLQMAARVETPADKSFALGYARRALPEAGRNEALRALVGKGLDTSRLIVWFVGTFGHSYDLLTVVRAARILETLRPGIFQFVICGSGDQERAIRAEALGAANVLLTGWLDEAGIGAVGSVAALGMQPYKSDAFQGLPNKLFEYLSFGLPVISSLRGESEDLISSACIGRNYRAEDPASLANCLLELGDDGEALKAMRCRARDMFATRFDANTIYPMLAQHIEVVAASGAP